MKLLYKYVDAKGKPVRVPPGTYNVEIVKVIHHRGRRRGQKTLIYKILEQVDA